MALASLHLVVGLVTIACVFPFVTPLRRDTLIQRWSQRLLRIFALRPDVQGSVHNPGAQGLVLVANHVSWLDIFVINAIRPARFIAKAELARWPLIGWLIRGVNTLFIDRSSRRHLHEVNGHVANALGNGDIIAVFPEGEVTDGTLHHFHGSLLQPAIEAGAPVQALAIRYTDASGVPTQAPVYATLSFVQSLWQVTHEPAMNVQVTLFPALPSRGADRRTLATSAETLIRQALASAPNAKAPETPGDR